MPKAKAKTKPTTKAKPATKAKAKPARRSASAAKPASRAKRGAAQPRKPAKRATRAAQAAVAPPAPTWAWHEVMTSDVAGAKAFYTGLFGWSAQDVQMASGPYTIFTKGAEQVAGAMAIPQHDGKPVCPPHWLAYLRVDDVDATVTRATELGARVDVAGMDIPGVGRFAILGDPTGATFAVYQSR